jgi:diguanylate cyclase (GGDEF)-like protein/PAS domain S-box-containing protein
MAQPLINRWPDIPRLASLVALYVLITAVIIRFFSYDGSVILVWPAGWLALALLLIGGKKYWPAIFAGSYVASLMLGATIPASLITAFGSTVGALSGALLLDRIRNFNLALLSPRDYLWLGVAAIVSSGVYALILSIASTAFDGMPQQTFANFLLSGWQKDALGIILATPIILAWQQFPWSWFSHKRLLETITCFGLALLAGQIIFLGWFSAVVGPYAKAFLMFIFIAWSAVRFGRQGVLLVIGFIGVQGLLGATRGVGFFAQDLAQTSLANLWFYMIVLTNVGLALDFVMHELRRSEHREKTRNLILEMLARDAPLLEILQTIVFTVEKENADMRCCIELVSDEDEQLFTGVVSSHSMGGYPAVHAVDIDVIPRLCTTPPHADKHTASDDGQKYPDFNSWVLADKTASLNQCWSRPIISHTGKTLGTISMYRQNAASPTSDDMRLIKQIANLAGIAVDQSRINEELQQALLVYQHSSDAMTVSDAEGRILNVNPAFSTVTGYVPDEIKGKTHKTLSSGMQDKAFYQAMWHAINTTGHWQGEIINRRKNGELYTEWLTINTTFKDDGLVHRRIALFSDITKKKEAEALIWKQANFDTLTGLPNRSMFLDRLGQEIRKSRRATTPLALLFIDIDHFKEVNDTLGHSMGDDLLHEASRRLVNCIRNSDTVARLGGDEFTVILSELEHPGSIERVAQNILSTFAEPFRLGDEVVYISASIGITLYPEDGTESEVLLKNADQAMYAAKRQGRNRYSYFTASMQEAVQTRMRLASDLRIALEENQFRIFYQPIVELASGTISKAEALLRWQHPKRGLVSPAEFIPVAEDTEIIVGIGDWVFRQAARQAALWKKSLNPDIQISINKSPVQFRHDGEHANGEAWLEYLHALGLPGHSIVLEITESLLLEANTLVIDQLHQLHVAGIQTALDDFGTGYSSLSYLKKFDIDFLKIDQSFVRNLAPGSKDMALCEAIIAMAHALGMKVIAEGVETIEHRELLATAGCDYGQGYLFSKPVPAEEFELLFSSRRMD